MNARSLIAALAIPCLCVAAEQAIGQDRGVYGPTEPARPAETQTRPPERSPQRLPVIEEEDEARRIDMLESWQLGEAAELGIGRFRVGEIARGRTHTERVRDDLMARENRAIGGAGLRIRFD